MLPPKHLLFLAGQPRAWDVFALRAVDVEQSQLVGLAPRLGLGLAVGFSFQPLSLERPHTGYALSPYPACSRTLGMHELTTEAIRHYLVAHADMWQSRRHYLGGWLDSETGKFHLDVSIIVQEKCEAERLVRTYKERAYFDIAKDKTIYVTTVSEHQSCAFERSRANCTRDRSQLA